MPFCKSSSLDQWNVGDDVDKIRALEENMKKLTTDADMIRVLEENITTLRQDLVRKISYRFRVGVKL